MYYQDLRNLFKWPDKECTNYLQENSSICTQEMKNLEPALI